MTSLKSYLALTKVEEPSPIPTIASSAVVRGLPPFGAVGGSLEGGELEGVDLSVVDGNIDEDDCCVNIIIDSLSPVTILLELMLC